MRCLSCRVGGQMVKLYCVFGALIWILGGWRSAHALPVPASLDACGDGIARSAISGDRLSLASGETLVLSGVKAPEIWPDASPYNSWPFSEKSRSILGGLTVGIKLQFFCEGEIQTINGERLAHIRLPDGRWLQHEMVQQGALIVFPRASHTSGLPSIYAAELTARSANRGLWAELDLLAEASERLQTGWFRIVSGTVTSAARVGDRIYLNFGENWRRDFTVEIPAPSLRQFKKTGLDPLMLQSRTIEVRGWTDWKGGPRILLEGPGQLRLIE